MIEGERLLEKISIFEGLSPRRWPRSEASWSLKGLIRGELYSTKETLVKRCILSKKER